ncbi:MAG: RNA polymerase sigma factor [Pirellulales bacterium]
MPQQAAFDEFILRIRNGDERAAEELVRQYEPLIRRAVRMRLEDDRLRRVFDSTDVCQSVLASFFARTALGQYDLRSPERLVSLLVVMTRNKVAAAARWQHSQRRDARRLSSAEELAEVADPGPSPSEQISGQELLEQIRSSFSAEESQIARLRKEGLNWVQIAGQLGGSAQARRVQFARAVERISQQIGLSD